MMRYLFGQMLLLLILLQGLSSPMTIVEEPAAISSTLTPLPSSYSYHVFLSFRGDIRYDIADLFYRELIRAGYNTFRDVDEIEIGKDIEVEIEKAIRESKVAVVLFSDGFASSTYCLDELTMFMERRRMKEAEVFGVFYKVDPDDVFGQKGSYGVAFKEHEEKLGLLQGEELQKEEQRLQRYRAALRQVSEVAGHVYNDGYLSYFIEKVVEDVSRLVNHSPLYVPPHLVGIDSLVEDINRWVQDGSNPSLIGVIYGPGGIGKKTIAKVVYNDNYKNFDCAIFLAKVGEAMKQVNGIVNVQRQLLSQIKRGKRIREFFSEDEGIVMIREAIRNKRLLILLTGVDQLDQFDDILKEPHLLKQGSKIIVTSRNEDLSEGRSYTKFGVKPLGYNEAFELFCWHAFGRPYPVKEYQDHVMTALPYCCGFPSAIEALGKALNATSPSQWEKLLRTVADIGHVGIQKVLKIIIDSMRVCDRDLFLDIATFYIGKDKDYVDAVVERCAYYCGDGIERLARINLVAIDEYNNVRMLQLIRDLGREIARQESTVKGRRHQSRCPRGAYAVLRESIVRPYKKRVSRGTRDVWSFIKPLIPMADAYGVLRVSMIRPVRKRESKGTRDVWSFIKPLIPVVLASLKVRVATGFNLSLVAAEEYNGSLILGRLLLVATMLGLFLMVHWFLNLLFSLLRPYFGLLLVVCCYSVRYPQKALVLLFRLCLLVWLLVLLFCP